jgi:hypothetical protein
LCDLKESSKFLITLFLEGKELSSLEISTDYTDAGNFFSVTDTSYIIIKLLAFSAHKTYDRF